MKTLIFAFALLASAPAFAKAPKWSFAAITTNPEVVSLVAAMEKHRGLRCETPPEKSVKVRKDGYATLYYSCNEYNEEGEPMANVTFIEIKGWAYADSFDLMRVKFIPME
jgi:hypothetical protein